jgi:hypothetical protein
MWTARDELIPQYCKWVHYCLWGGGVSQEGWDYQMWTMRDELIPQYYKWVEYCWRGGWGAMGGGGTTRRGQIPNR